MVTQAEVDQITKVLQGKTTANKAKQEVIHQVRWLHLAEPNLPTNDVLNALLLAGWTPPASSDVVGG